VCRAQRERKRLTQGGRFTEPLGDSGRNRIRKTGYLLRIRFQERLAGVTWGRIWPRGLTVTCHEMHRPGKGRK
jgi:hypothetical protein